MPETVGQLLDELPPVGSNNPPADANPLLDRLTEESAALAKRRDELLAAVARIPEKIEDEETNRKSADFVRLVAACRKSAEAMRVAEKDPFLAAERVVDGVFKK